MLAPCCQKWVECSECHDEMCEGEKGQHEFRFERHMKFTCKVCRKRFNRDFGMFSESDKFCNFCNTQWAMPGETPESKVYFEGKAVIAGQMETQVSAENPYFTVLPRAG
jgi:uncharacterized CHY-type Zn-finger protein